MCIFDADDTQICTPNTDSKDDDYEIRVIHKWVTEKTSVPQQGGLFGLSPAGESDLTLTSYYKKLNLIKKNQVTLKRMNSGQTLIQFGEVD